MNTGYTQTISIPLNTPVTCLPYDSFDIAIISIGIALAACCVTLAVVAHFVFKVIDPNNR
jgi:hypothetical protein